MQERDIFDNESEQRRFHSELITNMAEGVFLVSVDTGMIAYANPKANQMFDYEADTLAGVGMHTLIAPSHLTPVNIAENIKKSGVWKGEILCAKRSGLHFWCSILFSTFEHTKYGASWIAMCRDISERKRAVAELDTFFTLARDMLCIADESGYFKRVNPMFSKILGYTEWELTHRPFVEFVHPDDRQKTLDELVKLSKGIPSINFENRYVCKDGTYRDIAWAAAPTSGLFYASARDITERKKIEEEVRIERDKLTSIMQTIDDNIYITGQNYELQYINPTVEREFGPFEGYLCYEYFHGKNEPCPWCNKDEVFAGKTLLWEWFYPRNEKTYHRYDTMIRNKDGSTSKFTLLHNITEMKQAEAQIKAALKEKEMLVGEIHHRVKNNLAIISSLLKMQSYSITDSNARKIFKETENRIKSISTVHEMLYRSINMASVDFREYISKLIKTLHETYREKLSGVKLITDVGDVSLGINMAIPCGLLINELLTNAAKYAFADGKTGEIFVALHPAPVDAIELTVRDNGIGIPISLDIYNTQTLGCQLITGIATTQLGGTLELNREGGTEIKVRFKVHKRQENV